MDKYRNLISVVELRRLLYTIADTNSSVCIRYRLLGEMWQSNFMRVMRVTDDAAILEDEHNHRMIVLSDLSQVMQFELDNRIHHYIPNNHYEVTLKETIPNPEA